MKTIRIAPLLCVLLLIISCSGPRCAKQDSVKRFIFFESIDDDYKNSVDEDFIGSVLREETKISGLHINQLSNYETVVIELTEDDFDFDEMYNWGNPNFDAACLAFLELRLKDLHDITDKETLTNTVSSIISKEVEEKEPSIDNLEDFEEYYSKAFMSALKSLFSPYTEKFKKLVNKRLKEDPKTARYVIMQATFAYDKYCCSIASDEVHLINWTRNQKKGSNYKGYLLEYEIGNGYYVLLDMIEFDNGSLEYKILYQGESISDLNEYYR